MTNENEILGERSEPPGIRGAPGELAERSLRRSDRVRAVVRGVVAAAMVAVGVLHFVNPEPFVRIVPGFLPAPRALVLVSGVFEVALGLALLAAPIRRLAGYGLVALYVAVFPANLNMALNHVSLDPDHPIPTWVLWARLPLQILFIAVALWVSKRDFLAARVNPP